MNHLKSLNNLLCRIIHVNESHRNLNLVANGNNIKSNILLNSFFLCVLQINAV